METQLTIAIRLTEDERARFEGVARSRGVTLSRFIQDALTAYADEPFTGRPVDARARQLADGSPIGFTTRAKGEDH